MRTILVVDDNAENREFLRQTLSDAGCGVEVAASAKAGLKALAERRFDAVMLEIFLADRDGVEVIGELRGQGCDLPIVAVCGGSGVINSSYALTLAKAMGASEALAKPFSKSDLLMAVGCALSCGS